MINTLNALMIAHPILVAAKSDPDHALYHHVQDLPNFVHIEALQILYSQLEVFTNYFDSAHNFNVSQFVRYLRFNPQLALSVSNVEFQSGEYLNMMLHLAKWIGEKSLADANLQTALDVELRNMKRALVISCMEQLCRGYANGKDCYHSKPEPDCECFYVPRNEIQSRVSDIQKMASRLFYASSNWSSTGHENWFSSNMRMREVRLYWLASEDPVIVRNAHLLNKNCQNWAADADNALRKLSNILGMGIVQTLSDDDNEGNEFEDPDADTMALAADFAAVSANSQPLSQSYDVNQSTIESDVKKFLSQHPSHFSKCKF